MARYKKWTLEDLREGIDRFYQAKGRFPTVNDVGATENTTLWPKKIDRKTSFGLS